MSSKNSATSEIRTTNEISLDGKSTATAPTMPTSEIRTTSEIHQTSASNHKLRYVYDPNSSKLKNTTRALKYKLRCALRAKEVRKLENICFHTNAGAARFFAANPSLPLDLLRQKYGCTAFSRDFGYECFARDLRVVGGAFGSVFDTRQECIKRIDSEYSLWLSIEPNMINEGIFVLRLKHCERFIYNLNFITLDDGLMITCLQGCGDIKPLLKDFTKRFFGFRPMAFLVFYAFVFASRLGLARVYGVDDRYAISSFKRGKRRRGHTIDIHNLDEIYTQNCKIISTHSGYKQLSFERTPIEQISSNKRSMYKKRYALMDELASAQTPSQ